ncbi:SRPBCC family protein [Pseudomonas fildesensis]|uniref:Vanillate O-demethylase oxidoreductase VanB n=1 Tax=Pseudomonas fildesensis TaxID=1674920 RepID=A0A0J8FW23_9PSED|nr:SRPBCC family protein [Pseudomonas fildesensis]KMT52498.1 vanillate O-demethylase oxidoreductase VanB [Pseudomonas fildesensis]
MHVLDRIERKVLLNAPRKQVWEALIDAERFGSWFGIALKGKAFVAGETIEAPITYPGYEHAIWKARIERILPQTLFSFRWHPFAVEEGVDYDKETPTLVEFTIEDHAPGILLRVVESGFDAVPEARRQKAYKMNSRGWDEQMSNIETYLNHARQA